MRFSTINCYLLKKKPMILAYHLDSLLISLYRVLLLKDINMAPKWQRPSGPLKIQIY